MNTATSPYEYYGPTLCVRGNWLYEDANVITIENYRNLTQRGHLNVVRPGKGKGNYALVEFESMRPDIKDAVMEIVKPEDLKDLTYNPIQELIKPDSEAISYFATKYTKPDGRGLELSKQKLYCTHAFILNACREFESKHIARKKKGWIWEQISSAVNELEGFEHKLPANARALRRVYDKYVADGGGYRSLVHGGDGNDNSRKVNDKLERLFLSIYTMKNKPFSSTVHQIYLQFLGGSLDIVDTSTGELFDPQDFYKDGVPLVVSEATVWNYVNDPKNQVLVSKYRSGAHEYQNNHRPHVHRHSPMFSLSKISLDDRDLPRKLSNGKRVKAYYAYDVTSGCIIGASYSRDKDTKLFIDCIRDMLLFLGRGDFGIPMEMEVEHHIVNQFKHDLMLAGTCFPFVRWCNPGNSQEKRAEHFNKKKKYGYEKRYQDGIGRWYAKSEAHRTSVEKIFDGENNNYKERKYEYEQLIEDDKFTIEKYNNDLHPNKKRYPNMTRLDVLKSKINPNCAKFDEVIWARYVGDKTTTTIKRSQYVTVQYEKYALPSPELLTLLEPNNYTVDAYYIPDETGKIDRVVLYQNDHFICECDKIITYNESKAERTELDESIRLGQSKYIAQFDSMVKNDKSRIQKLALIENNYPTIKASQEDVVHQSIETDQEDEFADLLNSYDPEYTKSIAKENI